jgi:hypothetical protein
MPSKKESRLSKAFGRNEFGLADLPSKYSGVRISRLEMGEDMGCSYCFPHGWETVNSHWRNMQRNWKKVRKHQWKVNSSP